MIATSELNMAINYYENYGVVTEWMMKFQCSHIRELFKAMRESECEDIEDAIETEYVIYKDGKRYEYYELLYNSNRFSNTDEVNDFLLSNKLHKPD